MKRSFIREILESIDGETISFAGGLPNESCFPLQDLKEANMQVYDNASYLQYATSSGVAELRVKISDFYNKDGFVTDADNILITTGSQQALYIISRYFQNQEIIIEEPSYLGALNTFKLNNLNIKKVALYGDGIDTEMFESAYKNIKLAYIIPDFQNPTGAFYCQSKREKMASIVLENGGYIIEDAPYSELYFTQKAQSISSMLPNNTLHLGSFSKTLAPSLRVGWVRANKEIIKELLKIKETIDLHTCSIAQHTLNNYLQTQYRYKMHLKNLRINYRQKMEFFADALEKYLPVFKFARPEGGMFIYGYIEGVDSFRLVQECIKEKVVFVPANQFYLNEKISNEIRFNFTHTDEENTIKGLKKIAIILSKYR